MTIELSSIPTNDERTKPSSPLLRKAALTAATGVATVAQRVWGNRCASGFGILMYHRVAEEKPGAEAPTWNVTPSRLRRQLAGLQARGFVAWPLRTLLKESLEGREIPANVFAVTFDDGYANNYLHAWPILRELAMPATIFLATKYLDMERPFPFDDWSESSSSRVSSDSWRPITTRECGELLADGLFELGAHTHGHERFVGRADEFRRDLQQCLDILFDRFKIEKASFSFPFGASDGAMADVARELGVLCGLTTRHRRVVVGDDPFTWGRFNVGANDSAATLAAMLSGWYTSVAEAGTALTHGLTLRLRRKDRPAIDGSSPGTRGRVDGGRKAWAQS